jgi:Tol biopolymer transport system component
VGGGDAHQDVFPRLTGPYLGQKPPGRVPELFAPGIVSREGLQGKLFITPDGDEIIYLSLHLVPGSEQDPAGRRILFTSIKRIDGLWTPPTVLPFSEAYVNDEPCLSYDGWKLFFVSNWPLSGTAEPQKTPDIWMASRDGGTWGDPVNLGPPVNTEDVEVQPFFAPDDTLYFGRRDSLYYARFENGLYASPVKLDATVFKGRLSGVCLSPDNIILIVHSNTLGGQGGWDLFASFRTVSGGWTPLTNLGRDINTDQNETNGTFSPDGRYLFFTRGNDIFWVSAESIAELRPKDAGKG